MKILITGSSGFIGFHLSKKLLKLGHHITGVDNFSDYYDVGLKKKRTKKLTHSNFNFVNLDINDLRKLNGSFDLAINLAAQAGVRLPLSKHKLYKTTNEKGFKNFLDYCVYNNIDKAIYASSSSVYCDETNKKFCEDSSKLLPKSNYGKSKLNNEQYAAKFFKENKISLIGLRFFSVYGPWGRPDMAYYLFTEALKNNLEIVLHNQGTMARDMTYIDDVILGIVGAINFLTNNKKCTNEIFNLGNSRPIETKKMLNYIEKYLGKKARLKNLVTTNESYRTHANIEKSKKYLNYTPKVNFEEGMKSFLDWHEKYISNE